MVLLDPKEPPPGPQPPPRELSVEVELTLSSLLVGPAADHRPRHHAGPWSTCRCCANARAHPRPQYASEMPRSERRRRIQHVGVNDGTIMFSNVRDRVERRIEALTGNATFGNDRKLVITGNARTGDQPLKLEIQASAPGAAGRAADISRPRSSHRCTRSVARAADGQRRGAAERHGRDVQRRSAARSATARFTGWASVDLASNKPLVKLDLDFQRLSLAWRPEPPQRRAARRTGWSNASIDLAGLNYVDTQTQHLRGGAQRRRRPLRTCGDRWRRLNERRAEGRLANLGAYEGNADGRSSPSTAPRSTGHMRCSSISRGVRALPVLSSRASATRPAAAE